MNFEVALLARIGMPGKKRSFESNVDALLNRGGLRHVARRTSIQKPSELCKSLVSRFLWGELSAIAVQQLASAASDDGLDHEDIQSLSMIGTRGAHTSHCARDLKALLSSGGLHGVLTSSAFQMQMPDHVTPMPHAVAWPHKFWQKLWLASPAAFLEHCCPGGEDEIERFWNTLKGCQIYEQAKSMGLRKTVPLKLFGDGVAVVGLNKSWGKSVDAFLMSSLLNRGASKGAEIKVMITLVWKKRLTKRGQEKFWEELTASFKALESGLMPGTENLIAGGYKGLVVAITGDLEYLHSGYGLNNCQSGIEWTKNCKEVGFKPTKQ
eukprot:6480621-Amphidinium_carterae.2